MRILFLTSQLPYPPKSGGVIKSFRLLEHFSERHEVTLIHPLKAVDQEHLDDFNALGLDLKGHYYETVEKPRNISSLIKSYMGYSTLNVYRNYSKVLMEQVDMSLAAQDVLFIDHYEMGQYLPEGSEVKVILHEHNAEFIMWSRLAEIEKNPVKKILLGMESSRIAKAEKKYAESADQVWAAPNDKEELTHIGVDPVKMRTTYHLGEDFMINEPDLIFSETEKRVLYVGTLTWEANVNGLLWFFKEIWPILKLEPDLRLDIVGKNPDIRLLQAVGNDEQVTFLGFIDDLEPLYKRSRVFIVPLRFGSGIKVKVLNAMYRGLPLVTTEIGTEGLEVTDGEELFLTSDPQMYAERVQLLLNDENTWKMMMQRSREKSKEYTWLSLLAKHDGHLEELALN